jgi:hypothetical protein
MATRHLTEQTLSPVELADDLAVKLRRLEALTTMLAEWDLAGRLDAPDGEPAYQIDDRAVRDVGKALLGHVRDIEEHLAELRHALEASQDAPGGANDPDPVP